MRRKRRKFKLYHILITILCLYIVFTFIKQQVTINKLESQKKNKEEDKIMVSDDINEITKTLNNLEVNDLYEYIDKLEKEKEILSKDNYDKEELNKIRNDIRILENKLKNSKLAVYIEKIAREELKMLKSGEIIFIDKSIIEKKDSN